jgi:hypothetical protein
MLPWLPPYRVEIETWGKRFGDFAFGGAEWFLVSERFKKVYEESHLVGLSGFDPVEILNVKRYRKILGDPPRYYKVDVAQSATTVDAKASAMEFTDDEITCSACLTRRGTLKRWKGVYIIPERWSGEDIFTPRDSPVNFVTSRIFKDVCEANYIKNAVFIPAENYSHDFWP